MELPLGVPLVVPVELPGGMVVVGLDEVTEPMGFEVVVGAAEVGVIEVVGALVLVGAGAMVDDDDMGAGALLLLLLPPDEPPAMAASQYFWTPGSTWPTATSWPHAARTQLMAAPETFSKFAAAQTHLPSRGSILQVVDEEAASWRHLWEHWGMKGLMSCAATRAAEAARMKVEVLMFAVLRILSKKKKRGLGLDRLNERTTAASVKFFFFFPGGGGR